MIMSRYLPEPVLSIPPPGSAQDDSPTRLASSRLGDSGRRPFAAARRFGRRQEPGRWLITPTRGLHQKRKGRHLIDNVGWFMLTPKQRRLVNFLVSPAGKRYLTKLGRHDSR